MTVHELKPYHKGKTSLYQMVDYLQGNAVTCNIVSKTGNVVLSSSVVFAKIEEDVEMKDLLIVKSQFNSFFVSKTEAQKYILKEVLQTANGYDHHFIFQYVI